MTTPKPREEHSVENKKVNFMNNFLPTGFPATDNLYKFLALTGIIYMLVPGLFLIDQVNDLEEKRWELNQKMAKNSLETKFLNADVENIRETIRKPSTSSRAVITYIVESLKASPFATKIPESLITDLEEIVSKTNNPNIMIGEAGPLVKLFTDILIKLEKLRLSPRKDYEKLLEGHLSLLHAASIAVIEDMEVIQDENERLLQNNRQQELLAQENSIKADQLDALGEKIKHLKWIMFSAFPGGILLAAIGFLNWWLKIHSSGSITENQRKFGNNR